MARLDDGTARLRKQSSDFFLETFDDIAADAPGDSPIEKLLITALLIRAKLGATEYSNVRVFATEAQEVPILEFLKDHTHWANKEAGGPAAATTLFVRPQAVIGRRRVDFLIHALDWRDMEKWEWRKLIVECDGHDYHERTKEQARRDRSRDRTATMDGYDSFRFTGSEIWKDPWGCAEQITDWAFKGWGF